MSVTRVIMICIVTLTVILAVLFFFLAREYVELRHDQLVSMRELRLSALFEKHGPPTIQDIVFIRPWMTFTYVDSLFRLPEDYLRTNLPVADPRYPQITISRYAAETASDPNELLVAVQHLVRQYLMQAATSTAPRAASTTSKAL